MGTAFVPPPPSQTQDASLCVHVCVSTNTKYMHSRRRHQISQHSTVEILPGAWHTIHSLQHFTTTDNLLLDLMSPNPCWRHLVSLTKTHHHACYFCTPIQPDSVNEAARPASSAASNRRVPSLATMAGFLRNTFAPLIDYNDSDDSGYAEIDPNPSAMEPAYRINPGPQPTDQVVIQRIDPEAWESVRRRRTDSPLVPLGNWREHTQEMIVEYRRERSESWRNRQKGGVIVRHVDLHYFPAGDAPRNQGNVVNLSNGGQVLEKHRLFLIVGQAGDRVLECPIYTFGGRGLRFRDRATWPEYCSIRPLQVLQGDFENQSQHNKVLDVDWVRGTYELKVSMVVRLSDVRSRDASRDVEGVEIIATISKTAREYAAKKVMDLMSEAVMTARD